MRKVLRSALKNVVMTSATLARENVAMAIGAQKVAVIPVIRRIRRIVA